MGAETTNPLRSMRRAHENEVIAVLRSHGPSSRMDLAQATGLSRATLSAIVKDLLQAKRISAAPGRASHKTGRIPAKLALNPESGYAVGVDFGHKRVVVAAANASHQLIGSSIRPHAPEATWSQRADVAVGAIEEVTAQNNIDLESLGAIGIGLIGGGAVTAHAATHACDRIAERFQTKVLVENNTRLAGLAESVWGAAAELKDVIYLRLSHGIGGGLILDRQIQRGRFGHAGEFGHICVNPDGPQCRCSNRGCLETYASIDAVVRRGRRHGFTSLNDVLQALNRHDHAAQLLIAEVSQKIGIVLAGICNAVDVPNIVLGGELTRAGPHLLNPLRQTLARHVLAETYGHIQLATAQLGERDGALGGIAMVFQDESIQFPALGPALANSS